MCVAATIAVTTAARTAKTFCTASDRLYIYYVCVCVLVLQVVAVLKILATICFYVRYLCRTLKGSR